MANQLTMMDVVPDPFQSALAFSQLQGAQYRNRLQAMQMEEVLKEKSFKAAAEQAIKNSYAQNALTALPADAVSPIGPAPAPAMSPEMAMGSVAPAVPATVPAPQAPARGNALVMPSLPQNIVEQYPLEAMAFQQQQEDRRLGNITKIADAISKIGPARYKQAFKYLSQSEPLFAMFPPSEVENGAEVKAQDGTVLGQWIENPSTGKLEFVKYTDPARKGKTTYQAARDAIINEKGRGYEPTEQEIAAKQFELKNLSEFGVEQDDPLAGLTKTDIATVQKIANYELALPSGYARSKPYWQKIIKAVSAYDPTFDETQYATKLALKKDFNSGKSANNIRSLNTAIGHIKSLEESAKALNNSGAKVWNAIANFGLEQTGDPRVTVFNTNANAVESELAALFKGMGATDQEIKAWREQVSTSKSPEQLQGFVKSALDLAFSRLGALQGQYETGMGKPKDFRFLNDKSVKILQGMGYNTDALDPVAARQTIKSTPAERNNNPFNLKWSNSTSKYGGEIGSEAKDGGNFIRFKTKDEGIKAAYRWLFMDGPYKDLTVDAAMKKWSNSGYGGNIAPSISGKKVFQLNTAERGQLMAAMLKAEGSSLPASEPIAKQASTAPAVGAIQKGYRFKGGDPSKQANWEKV